MKPSSSEGKPVSITDHKMSIGHLRDSIKYNKDHMTEHKESIAKAKDMIKSRYKTMKAMMKGKK